ncbi:hypothetical protein GCM10023184_35050 [Flaviaesturariibacter amylovorans]|uniref:Secreted protein n=1 Tax=Flaviaesturariibacter amylovorans TaxID=1084520 RepID=A0ABP8HF90_9BACT
MQRVRKKNERAVLLHGFGLLLSGLTRNGGDCFVAGCLRRLLPRNDVLRALRLRVKPASIFKDCQALAPGQNKIEEAACDP